ncbi:nickel pincer cofactor biosynthesis protein LarC [Peptoniphilus equinus]|uniref:Pyridinium-3,5-bisthiocarboxylic acid mononucleotide nickel insertion protein n=1 Tax=Peptoniphilus equinus TaxID=3016343 RepID=A0ABY7QRC4_9FIRM|nr:nickel pincer cofactor biosynthesis protein LarC [Peptoniphilus equinus]WBW49338.1 nickel pincer cofactor biosynthesis protein LarC [Peptoniphilus equinus]
MKTLYIECNMGAAGDMLSAALLELFDDKGQIVDELNTLGLEGVAYRSESSVKCGISGTHLRVLVHGEEEMSEDCHHAIPHHDHHDHDYHDHDHHDHDHHDHDHHHHTHHGHDHQHHSLADIETIIDGLRLSETVKHHVKAVYAVIGDAESMAHGKPVADIHFHEVGTFDAIADITAFCYMIDKLGSPRVVVSPINLGTGQVKCAHGIMPVPTPATVNILKGIPVFTNFIQGELCTPTGAALLKHFAEDFITMPAMTVERIGYGMGTKDFDVANCVRVFLGEAKDEISGVVELQCNVDDMTGEAIGFAMDVLFEHGALEVYTIPIGMKKSRPGILLAVMCRRQDLETMIHLIFKHTTTIGIRQSASKRVVLNRTIETLSSSLGEVRKKISTGYGVRRQKYEYDDITALAKTHDLSLHEVIDRLEKECRQ